MSPIIDLPHFARLLKSPLRGGLAPRLWQYELAQLNKQLNNLSHQYSNLTKFLSICDFQMNKEPLFGSTLTSLTQRSIKSNKDQPIPSRETFEQISSSSGIEIKNYQKTRTSIHIAQPSSSFSNLNNPYLDESKQFKPKKEAKSPKVFKNFKKLDARISNEKLEKMCGEYFLQYPNIIRHKGSYLAHQQAWNTMATTSYQPENIKFKRPLHENKQHTKKNVIARDKQIESAEFLDKLIRKVELNFIHTNLTYVNKSLDYKYSLSEQFSKYTSGTKVSHEILTRIIKKTSSTDSITNNTYLISSGVVYSDVLNITQDSNHAIEASKGNSLFENVLSKNRSLESSVQLNNPENIRHPFEVDPSHKTISNNSNVNVPEFLFDDKSEVQDIELAMKIKRILDDEARRYGIDV